MKKIKLLLLTLLGCFLMTSCYVTKTNMVSLQDDYYQALKGLSYNELVQQFGAPDRQTDDGAGGRILIYETITYQNDASTKSDYYGTGYTTRSSMTTNTTYIHIYVNQDNVCYNVKTNLTKKETERYKDKKLTRLAWIAGGEMLALSILLVVLGISGEL